MPPVASVPSKKATDDVCDICKVVVKFVYDELQDNKTEEEVKKLLDKVCSVLPESLKQTCTDTVNTYYDQLVQLIIQGFTPEEVCAELSLCTSASKKKPVATRPAKVANDEECTYCTTIVQYVYDALQDEKTEEEIKEALDEVCNLFHGDRRQKCVNMVNTYFEIIVSLILQDFTPQQICETIGLCPSSTGRNIECTFCQYALHFIQNELVENDTEARVEAVLDKLCSKLPNDLAKECMAFVEEYGPAVMVLLAQEIDPSIVCVAIKVCPKDGLQKQSDVKLQLNECATCKAATSYVEQILKDTKNDQEVAKQLANACDRAPKALQSQCKALIKTYGPALLRTIAQVGSGEEACKKLDICSNDAAPHKHRQLKLGSNPCTRGPAHWCHSKENAAACKATPFCEKKVWKQ
uniref:Saposin n=1 Tax=Rhipicephalus zambeziensis TaxID=60191 RepID=A0A224Z8B0_9ACAR